MVNEDDKRIIMLTGPPGAGKGTQARIISKRHGWHSFSIGEILRQTADPEIKAIMDAGTLLPAEQVVGIVVDELRRSPRGVVVDGFPRRLDQAEAFDEVVDRLNLPAPEVIFVHIDKDESWRRVKGRGRVDDEHLRWEHRWQEYSDKTLPAIDYCRQNGILTEVDGSGNVEEVTRLIEGAISEPED